MAEKRDIAYYRDIVSNIRFENYTFNIIADDEFAYLQANYLDKDIVTGEWEQQYTRKWRISPFMTKSEFVQTCFKCCMTSYEHRAREHFRYRNIAVFGPHFDVEQLVELGRSGGHDYRSEP